MPSSTFVGVVLVALAGSAAAKGVKKPTAAQAVQTATKWAEQLEAGEARPLTADSFVARLSIDGPEPNPCAKISSKQDDAIGKLLDCVREHAPFGRELVAVKSLTRNVPYLSMFKKQLTAAMTTATLVYKHGECAGQGDDVAIAVSFDKDGVPKVSAVFYASVFCGE